MSVSLEHYRINPVKFGQIIRVYAEERGISQAAMAKRAGCSGDTIGHIYAGHAKKSPTFELVMKFSVILGVPIEVLELLCVKDEDVDFIERVPLYDPIRDEIIKPLEDVPSMSPAVVPDAVAATASAIAAAMPTSTIAESVPQPASADALVASYEARIADLKEQLAHERAASERHLSMLQAMVARLCDDADPRRMIL